MKDYKLISKICLWVLFAAGLIVSIMFFVGGADGSMEVAGDFLDIPRFSDLYLSWNYVLVVLGSVCFIGSLGMLIAHLWHTNRSNAIILITAIIGLALLFVVCWFLGSPAEVKIVGYEGGDNVGAMARLSDACIYMTYILVVMTVCAMAWGMWYTKRLK